MFEIIDYKENQLYTIEQVRNSLTNLATVLKLELVQVTFNDRDNAVYLQTSKKDNTPEFIDAKISFDLLKNEPKIIVSLNNLNEHWFYKVFHEQFEKAQERAGVFYVKQRLSFGVRSNTLLEFLERDHAVTSYLIASKGMTKKICSVADIVNSEQILFELICFKLFSDNVAPSASSIEDLIKHFDKHYAVVEMKNI